MEKIVIIGGMAAGCKAAARLKRVNPKLEVAIIEKRPFASFGACGLPYFASGDVDDFDELMKTAWGTLRDEKFFREAKGIELKTRTAARKIEPTKKEVECEDLRTGEKYVLKYDKLLIATGATHILPKFPYPQSERISFFHDPEAAKPFREKAQRGEVGSVCVVGGGFIGCELAEAASALWGLETTLIEAEDRLLPRVLDKDFSFLLEKLLVENGIAIKTSARIKKIEEKEDGGLELSFENGEKLESDYAFICVGVKPNAELAREIGIKTGKFGGVITDERMRTNVPDIWAAGDCVETRNLVSGESAYFPLGSLANRQGRTAADDMLGLKAAFPGSAGTASARIFGTTVGVVGLTEKGAEEAGKKAGSVLGCWFDRPHYMPESKILFGKLIYEKGSLKLLGAQILGKGEVTRYIDALSALIGSGATAYEALNWEHAYAPAHSSPLSPINYLGAMAISQDADGIICVSPLELEKTDRAILDLRKEEERKKIVEKTKYKIPFDSWLSEAEKIPKDEPILAVCEKGPRAFEVAATMKKLGWKNAAYLGGGYQFFEVDLKDD